MTERHITLPNGQQKHVMNKGIQTNAGETAIFYALRSGNYMQSLYCLHNLSMDPNIRNINNQNLLDIAEQFRRVQVG